MIVLAILTCVPALYLNLKFSNFNDEDGWESDDLHVKRGILLHKFHYRVLMV